MKTEIEVTDKPDLIRLNPGVYPAVWSNGARTIVIPEKPIQSIDLQAGDVDALVEILTADPAFALSIGMVNVDAIDVEPITDHYSGEFGGEQLISCALKIHPAWAALSDGFHRGQKEFFDLMADVVGNRARDLPRILVALKNVKIVAGSATEAEVGHYDESETTMRSRKVQGVNAELPTIIHYSGPLYINAPVQIEMAFKIESKENKFRLIPIEREEAVLASRRALVAYLREAAGEGHAFYLGR